MDPEELYDRIVEMQDLEIKINRKEFVGNGWVIRHQYLANEIELVTFDDLVAYHNFLIDKVREEGKRKDEEERSSELSKILNGREQEIVTREREEYAKKLGTLKLQILQRLRESYSPEIYRLLEQKVSDLTK